MKAALLLTSLLLIAPVASADTGADPADCTGPPCDQVNLVCETVFGRMCLGLAPASSAGAECTGYWLCDTINDVCGDCIPATATEAEGVECMGPGCEEVNEVCRVVGLPDSCVE